MKKNKNIFFCLLNLNLIAINSLMDFKIMCQKNKKNIIFLSLTQSLVLIIFSLIKAPRKLENLFFNLSFFHLKSVPFHHYPLSYEPFYNKKVY